MALAAISSEGVAIISASAAVLGALVGGLVTGGTTLVAEGKRRGHADALATRERYARARVAARLVFGEMLDHITSIQVERERKPAEIYRAWPFRTAEWDAHRTVLFDIVEHSGWVDLTYAYIAVGLCEDELARAEEQDAAVGPEAPDEDDDDAERTMSPDARLQEMLATTEEALARAHQILLPITRIGLPNGPSPQALLELSAAASSGRPPA